MNIAIILDTLGDQAIGSIVSSLGFADRLRKRGHNIIFIASKYPGSPSIDYFKGYKVYRFRSIMLPRTEKKMFICFPTAKQIKIMLKKEKIEILHFMMPTPAAIVSVKAAKHLGIRIVAHSHTQPENILLNLPKIFHGRLLNYLFYKYMIWIYRKADIVVCPSKFAEKVIKKYSPTLNTIVISNGINLSNFRKIDPALFLKKNGLQKNQKKILFVGRLNSEKNTQLIIKAMPLIIKEIKNIKLLIVGVGFLESYLKELSRKLHLEKYVQFFGRIEHDDLLGAYNACDLFILPSFAELEGIVVLEAMACSKPILIANAKESASAELVKENGLLFRSKDQKDLAAKALKILKDDKLRSIMGKNSCTDVKKYDINKSVNLLEKVYKSL